MSASHKKIIFTGPVGAGKTTAIKVISDIDPITTDQNASDMTQHRKSETTVAMDYGVIMLGDNEKVHLYGTPGQQRFDFMWSILTNGGIGLVLLLDNTRKDPLQDLKFYTRTFHDFIEEQQMIVGVTRMDLQKEPGIQTYRKWLAELGYDSPVFAVDARSSEDVSVLLRGLLLALDPGV